MATITQSVRVFYDSNNSGGSWWLDDEDWHKLEAAGWTVNWEKDQDDLWGVRRGDRFLGALATSASKVFPTLDAGIAEWERITGQDPDEPGCECCGQPHYFYTEAVDDEETIELEEGEYTVMEHADTALDHANTLYAEMIEKRLAHVVANVPDDIRHQVNKYGYQRVNGRDWIAIIVEEFGEATQAYLKQDYDEAIKEAYQAIACLIRFTIEVERERDGLHELEAQHYVRPQ